MQGNRARHRSRPAWARGAKWGVAASLLLHAAPVVTAVGPLRRACWPSLSGAGAPGGVALTFDDGPDPAGTPAVLAVLAELGWTATFFLLGSQVRQHPEVARSVAAAGHEIAVHGDRHVNHLRRTAPAVIADVRAAAEQIRRTTGTAPRWYRPPYGVLTGGTLLAARSAGLTPVLWTAWGKDWRRTTPAAITATVMRDLREGGAVLLHDSDCTSAEGSWRGTVNSLPLLAAALDERGWAVRTLTQHVGAAS